MRCPSCQDDFEPDMTWCGMCHTALVADDAPDPIPTPDARLGVFHPTMAEVLLADLTERGIPYETVTRAEAMEIVVPRRERDDLRLEFTLGWSELLTVLPDEQAHDVRRLGGDHPGWLDPPEGGWVDREGRLVVDAHEDAVADASRTLGPMLAVIGVALLLLAWYLGLGMGVVFAAVALLIFGLLVPR